MILNKKNIEELFSIIDYFNVLFIGTNVGEDMLLPEDIAVLRKFGISSKFLNSNDYLRDSFKFGIVASALTDKRVKNFTYDTFKKFLASGNFLPLTKTEEYALQFTKQQFYGDIKGLGNRMKQQTNQIIVEASRKQRLQTEKIIQENLEDTILNRKTLNQLSSQLGEKTKDWARDFDRISDYIMHDAYQHGVSTHLLENYGENVLVYFRVYQDACEHCVRVYLTDGVGSEPRIFKLTDVIKNGSNIGVKAKDYKPSVTPLHPWSLTDKTTLVLTDKGWKQIQFIQESDYVLTHQGRFKKVESVTNVPVPIDYPINKKYNFEYIVNTKRGNKKTSLTLTAEHKILTQRGWVEAQNVLITDRLIKLKKPCANKKCKNLVDLCTPSNRNCCSKKCIAAYRTQYMNKKWNTKNGFLSAEIKQKISEKVSKNWEKGLHKNTLSNLQSDKNKKICADRLNENGTALKMLKKAGYNITSKPQLKLFELVRQLYPKAVLEYEIFNKSLDIALVKEKIDIEYDGKYFHKGERLKKDSIRDILLKDNGWHVLRYDKLPTIQQLNNDIQLLANNSLKKYDFEEIVIEKINVYKLNKTDRLYDIGVADDESFIARGVVIHNCRCGLTRKPENSVWDFGKNQYILTRNDYGVKRKTKIIISHA